MKLKKQSFREFDNEMDEISQEKLENDVKKSGELLAENYFERLNSLLIAWATIETNKLLIKVTWILALATILLGIVNLVILISY